MITFKTIHRRNFLMTKTIFREYDIRGIYEKELNEQSVKAIGFFLGQKIKDQSKEPLVAIGYDARSHSPILKDWLVSGLNASGCEAINLGLVATPINYFANYQSFEINSQEVMPSASIMITGSHNPSEYNGFKITIDKKPFFGEQIYALGDEIIANPIEVVNNTKAYDVDVVSRYIDFMVEEFRELKGMDQKIVIDCGNGVADIAITKILDKLELNYKALYATPDGTFPNHHPDPSVEKNLVDIKKELEGDFDIGFAYDGDADRVAVLTQKYNIKGDILALLLSKNMNKPTVIGEVKCSQVMYDEINKRGGQGVMYKTGHSNLKMKIKELNASLAAEVSGHIFFNDRYFGFDDALYATFRVLELLKNGMDLDAEVEALPKVYSTEEIKVEVSEESKFAIVDKFIELLQNPPATLPKIREVVSVDGARVIFDKGWGLVRASNTTPVLVTRFESIDEQLAKIYEEEINTMILQAKELVHG